MRSRSLGFKEIWFQINEGCNFSCEFCFYKYKNRDAPIRELSINALHRAMNILKPHIRKVDGKPEFTAVFFATEPSLSMPLIKKYTPILRGYGANRISMTTNGYALKHEDMDWIVDEKVGIAISFEGNRIRQDLMRRAKGGQSTYDKVVGNIEYLKSKGKRIQFLTLIEPIGYRYIYDAVVEMIENDYLPMYLNLATDSITEEWNRDMLKELEIQLRKIAQLVIDEPSLLRKIGPYPRVFTRIKGKIRRPLFRIDDGRCGAGRGSVAVDIDGHIMLCQKFLGVKDPLFTLEKDGAIDVEKVLWWRKQRVISGTSMLPMLNTCFYTNWVMTGDPFKMSERYTIPYLYYNRGLILPVINKMLADEVYANKVRELFST